ncbi:MAG: 16S rRNA (cytidine(1402)-2'-O)-methyltransferase [Planctomycetota bacterium]
MTTPGKVYLVPTPIGNLGDITVRGVETLKAVDVIACEDTRRTGRLLAHYEIRDKRLARFHEHNERESARRLLQEVLEGRTVALVTDAGMPSISDPGYRLVEAALEAEVEFEVLPGASAVPVALALSGLPVAGFTFRGFPPRKGGKLRRFLEETAKNRQTQILFESPYRVGKLLEAALEVYGDRQAAVCRELTKLHEEVVRGSLTELVERFRQRSVKGEITVVIEGWSESHQDDADTEYK